MEPESSSPYSQVPASVRVINNKFNGKAVQENGRGLFEVLVDIRLEWLKKSKYNTD